jgi:hypothetical protein
VAGGSGRSASLGDAEHGVGLAEGAPVVEQHLAQAYQRVIHLFDLGLDRTLVARDRADDVAAQGARSHGDAGQADVVEALGDAVQRGTARAHDEHALVLADERADRVDDGLRSAGAGQGLHHEGVAGGDLGDHVLLLGVRVEEQRVGLRRPGVGALGLDGDEALLQGALRGGVSGDGVEHGVLEVADVGDHGARDVDERRDHESRAHVEPLEVARESAQAVDDGVRLEGAVVVGQGDERLGVELEAELGLEGAREFGVEERRALELDLEVAAVAADGERAQQHRCAEVGLLELPLGDAHAEVHGVDAAGGGELEALRGDESGRGLRRAEGEVVADEAREQRGLAGDELRETARVGGAQFDAGARGVDEVQQRRASAERGEFCAPRGPGRFGHVSGFVGRVSQTQRVGRCHLGTSAGSTHLVLLMEVVVCSLGTPHMGYLKGLPAQKPGGYAGFFQSAPPKMLE